MLDQERESDVQGDEERVDLSTSIPEPDINTVIRWIAEGCCINIYGYMGAGKTTLCEVIGHCNYDVVDEVLWDLMCETFAMDDNDEARGDFYTAVGAGLAAAYTEGFKVAMQHCPDKMNRKVFNVWVPHMPECKNLYLLIRREDILQDRPVIAGGGLTADKHVEDIHHTAMEYVHLEGSMVFTRAVDLDRLRAGIEAMHNGDEI